MDYAYTIWGRPNCIWCERAKQLLEDVGEPYDYIELNSGNQQRFAELTNGARTVPQIFDPVGGLIGGHDNLKEFLTERISQEVNM